MNSNSPAILKSHFFWGFFAVFLLGLNLFGLTPWLTQHVNPGAGQIAYVVMRLVVFVGFGYVSARFARRSRFQIMGAAFMVGVVDQCIFKWFIMQNALKSGEFSMPLVVLPPTALDLIYGIGMGFMFFAPIILILTFFGVQLSPLPRSSTAA